MRVEALQPLTGGINRLAVKGGADPRQLYDLLNGYVDQNGRVQSRPGVVRHATLPAGTKGLMAHDGGFLVFAGAVTAMPAGYACDVLVNPTSPSAIITRIHHARRFVGAPYVVAEFDNGDVIHYWLQAGDAWAANTAHQEGDVIAPGNGLAYRAKRLNAAAPAWAPNIQRTVGDIVEPTVPNGFQYAVTEIVGDASASGETEPDWVAEDGAAVSEFVDVSPTGGGSVSGGGTGGSGGSIPPRYCVAATMLMGEGTAADVLAGDLHPCHKPGEGFADLPCLVAGEPVVQPCVRLVTRYGAVLVCSTTTPFTFPGASQDLADGQWAYAPDMRGKHVYVRRNGKVVVEDVARVSDAGELPVVPLDFGGRSFAAGEDASALIYSHNMAKQTDPEGAL